MCERYKNALALAKAEGRDISQLPRVCPYFLVVCEESNCLIIEDSVPGQPNDFRTVPVKSTPQSRNRVTRFKIKHTGSTGMF